ncbi:VWA domain-containing protein [Rubrivirga sp.]|uniref:VWA domain-containing protein n=1 Tax=Rubrivirga sp. TaxID=1885344 RepID=UPI003B51BECC
MSFRSPAVLLLAAVLVPAALAAFAYAARERADALRLFLGARADTMATGPMARRRRVRAGLIAASLGLVGVALAGPRIGTALRESRQESLDLLIALDVSASMLAEDVAPSRLERAKLEIERVVDARRGDRVGLVVFAGEAFLQCPLTTDRGALRLFLDAADPEQVAVQGTDFARALAVADAAFNAGDDDQARPRALLVVSDGEDHEGGLSGEADALRDDGVEILALGVGTDEGAAVPDVRRGRVVGERRDRQTGAAVVTRFEPGALRDLAGRAGLFRVGRTPAAGAVNDALDGLDRAVVAQDEFAASAERFQWPLALALLLLVAERLVALRPPPRRPMSEKADDESGEPTSASPATRTASVAAALALVLLSGCTNPLDALAPGAREGRAGVALLEDGDAAGAEAQFVAGLAQPEVPRDLRARLWHALGVARAAQDRFSGADSAFAQALPFADTPDQRARYATDAGTAALLADDPARADSLLRVALLIDPTLDAARRNQEIARRRLQDPPSPPEPTPFAERVKARADSLVAARQYRAALDVMEDGLERDSSVAAYADFTQRLGGVVRIEETVSDTP